MYQVLYHCTQQREQQEREQSLRTSINVYTALSDCLCQCSAGQLIDHELVATVDDQDGPAFNISLANGADTANMILHRTVNDAPPGECPLPPQVITPQIDAGVVYGNEPEWLEMTLRSPGMNSHLAVPASNASRSHLYSYKHPRPPPHTPHPRILRVILIAAVYCCYGTTLLSTLSA